MPNHSAARVPMLRLHADCAWGMPLPSLKGGLCGVQMCAACGSQNRAVCGEGHPDIAQVLRGHVCMSAAASCCWSSRLPDRGEGNREFARHVRHAGSVCMLPHSLSVGLPPASLAAWENLETWESNIAAPEIPHHSRRSQVRIAESGSAAEETPAERQHRGCCDTESGLHQLRVRTQPIRFTTN